MVHDVKAWFAAPMAVLAAAVALCCALAPGAALADETPAPITAIQVGGEVGNAYEADLLFYAQNYPMMRVRNIACYRHSIDSTAMTDESVLGFSLVNLVKDAALTADVDTITFISAAGETLTMPLAYVVQPFAVIILGGDVDGSGVDTGFSNVLLLDSVTENAAMTDVVAIEFSARGLAAPEILEPAAAKCRNFRLQGLFV